MKLCLLLLAVCSCYSWASGPGRLLCCTNKYTTTTAVVIVVDNNDIFINKK